MANPTKASKRERVEVEQKIISPEGSELKKIRGNAGMAGMGSFYPQILGF